MLQDIIKKYKKEVKPPVRAVRVDAKKRTCPYCGADWESLRECLSSPAYEDRSTAWILIENCAECKATWEETLNG